MADAQPERLPLRGLQIDEDIRVEQRAWTAERFGWVGIAAVIVLALLGLFGPGPLSHESVESPDASLHVDYNRFIRMGGTTSIEVEISGLRRSSPSFSSA